MPQQSTTFQEFLAVKDKLAWRQASQWIKSENKARRNMVWRGYDVVNGKVSDIPAYFAFVTVDDEAGTIGIALSANIRFDAKGRGQQVIDRFMVGNQSDAQVSDQLLVDVMRQRYGMQEIDFTKTPVSPQIGTGVWKENREAANALLIRKTLYNEADKMLALVLLKKITYLRGPDRYAVQAVVVPIATGVAAVSNRMRTKPATLNVKDGMADFYRTVRELRGIGFASELDIPTWANEENWDFDLGAPMKASKELRESFEKKVEEYSQQELPSQFGEDFDEGDDASAMLGRIFGSSHKTTKIAQDTSQYYNGPLPSPDQLDQYVGTSSVEASQIRGIFGGVDDAINLVNQFDSSLLRNVAFIYNISGGGAYGVYMSALDEKIKNEELKKLLKMDGYTLQDMPDGSFYATHPKKDQQQIDNEIKAYRQKIDQSRISTFGIDMNKVIEAARADSNESNPPITDSQDQYLLGVLHLGATMVHEAVHSLGSNSEGPSEGAESKFMAWAMPIINQRRQQRYQNDGKEGEYSPLIIDSNKRRMASAGWLDMAGADGVLPQPVKKVAQYGAQFLHNQDAVKHFGPAPWSSAFWSYGIGPIEDMLDRVRPQRTPASKSSFEGQLRQLEKDRWTSSIDAGVSTEELLEPGRTPLNAYQSTESLMEGNREKPLILAVPKMSRKASSYDTGKEAFGQMANLDLEWSDRIQKFDKNDEDTTWFDSRFVRNQPRYQPEYGNPLSKEDGIMSWVKDFSMQISSWQDAMNERGYLRTSPWQRAASDQSQVRYLGRLLEHTLHSILSGNIRGTRFSCSMHAVPLIRKFFENDADIRVDAFGTPARQNVWVVSASIPEPSVKDAEDYVTGESEDEAASNAFEYITCMGRVKTLAVSRVIECVSQASREAGIEKMFILGDFPLAIKTGQAWDKIRTVDFCSDDADACIKIGELVGDMIGAEVDSYDPSLSMLLVRKAGMTFRFRGDLASDAIADEFADRDIEPSTINYDLYGRTLTPLMLAFDVMTEEVVDPTGEAIPDVDAKVVRSAVDSERAIRNNPLSIVDAVFLAAVFGFSIDSSFSEAAAKAEFEDPDAKSVWGAIKAAGKGKSTAVAEEYGLDGAISKMTGGMLCQCQ